ncbi:hypothetical protein ED729_05860 [Escherichia coli]|nr:hypothetical protein [Escherichia coli]HCS0229146.1 hypothetical protein [Escherichia coli]
MSNKIENPVVIIHKRENHDSYAVAITNGSHDYYDGLLIASVSPDDSDHPFAMVGYYMAAEIEKLRAQRDALAAENAALKKFCKDAAFDADYEAELGMERGGFSDALNDIKTPATDAFLAEIERKAIRKFINSIEHILRDKLSLYDTEEMLEVMRIFLEEQGVEQK